MLLLQYDTKNTQKQACFYTDPPVNMAGVWYGAARLSAFNTGADHADSILDQTNNHSFSAGCGLLLQCTCTGSAIFI